MIKGLVRYGIFAVATLVLSAGILLSSGLSGNSSTASAGAPLCTWTGAGGNQNFTTAGNWTCETGTVPVDGTTVVFPLGIANRTANNNLASNVVLTGVSFTGACSGAQSTYTINGTNRIAGDFLDETTGDAGCLTNTTISNIILFSDSVAYPRTNFRINGINTSTGFTLTANKAEPFGATVSIFGAITGSGQIIVTDNSMLSMTADYADATAFTGSFLANNGGSISISVVSANMLGSRPFNLGDTGRMWITLPESISTITFANPISISGNPNGNGGGLDNMADARLAVSYYTNELDAIDVALSYPTAYHFFNVPNKSVTFSGAITLNSNFIIANNAEVNFTGAISGPGYQFVRNNPPNHYKEMGGPIVLNGSTNTSATPNGTYLRDLRTTVSAEGGCVGFGPGNLLIGRLNKVIINGECYDVIVAFGGIIGGSGIVGDLSLQTGKAIPGDEVGAGVLTTQNLSFDSTSSLDARIEGTTPGLYSQIDATGTVTLGNAVLSVEHLGGFIPTLNDTFTIINNDDADAVIGTFNGLAEGATITVDEVEYIISYVGGTGNDVVLTADVTPGPPDTAGVLANPISIAAALGVILAGVGALLLRHKYLKATKQTVPIKK